MSKKETPAHAEPKAVEVKGEPPPKKAAAPGKLRKFAVSLERVPEMIVEAEDEGAAWVEFMKLNNITATVHPHKCVEVTS